MSPLWTTWPHKATAHRGYFRRAWITCELTEQDWNERGILHYDADGNVVYSTVQRLSSGDEDMWAVKRHIHVAGRLKSAGSDRYETLTQALAALSVVTRASVLEHGPVPEHEWPEDADAPWIIYSVPKRADGKRRGG